MLTKSKWTARLIAGVALTTLVAAQDQDAPKPDAPVTAVPEALARLHDMLAPKSASFTNAFGVEDVQGQLRLYGKIGLENGQKGEDGVHKILREEAAAAMRKSQGVDDPPTLSATGGLAADVLFWGKQREIVAIELECKAPLRESKAPSNGRSRSGAVASREEWIKPIRPTVRLVGFTIRCDRDPAESTPGQSHRGASGKSNQKVGRFGPKDLLPQSIKAQFMAGPVPILILANGAVGIELGATPFVEEYKTADGSDDLRVGMDATVGGYLNGWVAAGIGAGCSLASVVVGLKADIRPIDAAGGIKLGCGLQTGLFAQLHYKIEALVVKALAIAEFEIGYRWLKITRKFEYLLFEWTAKVLEGSIPPAPIHD